MATQLIVSPEANQELDDAAAWCERERVGRGRKFAARVRECFEAIRRSPRSFTVYRGPYRRIVARPFPYLIIYYHNAAANTVTVVTVFHTSRDPNDLLGRLP